MDNLNFENNYSSSYSSASSTSTQKSFMVSFLMKKGIVKTESAGNAVLLIFALILIGISFYSMYKTLNPNTSTSTQTEQTVQDVGSAEDDSDLDF